VPLTAAESRIAAAIFGGGFFVYQELIEAARRITVPVQFLLPWDDEHVDRQSALALFDAFASGEKTLHANPGDHRTIRWTGGQQRVPDPASRPGWRGIVVPGRILGGMGRIIGTIIGAILAIWFVVTTAGGILATFKVFLIIGVIALAVFLVVWLVAGRSRRD
jgi:hypothetical protein